MFILSKPKPLYFDNDEAFIEFAIVPMLIMRERTNQAGETHYCYDYDFSYEYKKAIKDGVDIVIKDPDSLIFKHGSVCYRGIAKPVSNLKDWVIDDNFTFDKKNK